MFLVIGYAKERGVAFAEIACAPLLNPDQLSYTSVLAPHEPAALSAALTAAAATAVTASVLIALMGLVAADTASLSAQA